MLQSLINRIEPLEERILEFKGLNRKNVVDDGELRDMKNLASDEYPCLYQRKARGLYDKPPDCKRPISMIQKKNELALIGQKYDGTYAFFYGGAEISKVAEVRSLTKETQMVAINSKICFFPQKTYYDVVSKEAGTLDASFASSESLNLELNDETGEAKLSINTDVFSEDDVIELECKAIAGGIVFSYIGDVYVDENNLPKIASKVLGFGKMSDGATDCIILESAAFQNLLVAGNTTATITELSIKRTVPDLDYILESNNRLWGVSDEDNTIYACKLGDPKNWQYYQGTSMDSYYAEQGTDGEWTGAAAYSNHLLFFKEGVIHKVYGSTPSSYQITTTQCYGLEKGSSKSVAVINDMVIYKSQIGFMAYEGDTPYCISEKFGNAKFNDVVAGTNGLKYYASIHNTKTNQNWIVVCDVEKALWHKEDNVRVRDFCFLNGSLIFINDYNYDYFEENQIYIVDADEPIPEEKEISWCAEIGPFDEYVENKKVYSRLEMRLEVPEDTALDFYIKMDEGEWEYIDRRTHTHGFTVNQVFTPRRCNKFAIRICGTGNCRIDSLKRRFRSASGGAL